MNKRMSSGRIYLQRIDKTSVPSKGNYVVFVIYKGNFFGNFCFEHKDIAKNSLCDCFYLCKRNLPNNFEDNFFQKTYQNFCSNKSTFWSY